MNGKLRICWCDSEAARAYVEARRWEALDGSAIKLPTCHRGNVLWLADVAPFGKVVVKMSRFDSSYPFFKRLEGELRLRLVDGNLRDAKMALTAERLGVATYHPLAVWRVRGKGWTTSFIMYTFVEGRSLKDICRDGAFDEADRPVVKRHLAALGKSARRLHDGGLRHRDLVPGNILVRPDDTLAILDFASGYPVRCRWPRYRKTQDFASLRRLAHLFDADCLAAFSEGYCGTNRGHEYEHTLLLMLFWKYNGHRRRGCFNRFCSLRSAKTAYDID